MDVPFLVAIGGSLCFLTLLIVLRMRATGVPSGVIAVVATETWLAAALWAAGLCSLAVLWRVSEPPEMVAALANWSMGLAAVLRLPRSWPYFGLVLALGLLLHVVLSLRRSAPEKSPERKEGRKPDGNIAGGEKSALDC